VTSENLSGPAGGPSPRTHKIRFSILAAAIQAECSRSKSFALSADQIETIQRTA
jgi:hypothetical protein